MLFDSHAHLDDERFDEDREQVIEACITNGVSTILNASADIKSSYESVKLAEKYDFIYAAVGVHPHSAEEMNDKFLEEIVSLAKNNKVVAIGEIGLDYYYDNSPRDIQKIWFIKQIEAAKKLNLPIIVHDRDAHEDTLKIIKEAAKCCTGVLHCYSGSVEMAKELINLDFYISFTGAITFKNAKKSIEVIKYIPEDRLLIETDCPYLTPEPFRGKRNFPGHVKYVAQKIAEIRKLPFEHVAKVTSENAKRLFRI